MFVFTVFPVITGTGKKKLIPSNLITHISKKTCNIIGLHVRAEEGEHNYDLLFNLLNKINWLDEMKNMLLLIMFSIGSTVNAVIPCAV